MRHAARWRPDRPVDPQAELVGREVVDAVFQIHAAVGPVFTESIYARLFAHEMDRRGLSYEREKRMELVYRELRLDAPLRADFLVDDRVVVELKAVEDLHPVHFRQVLGYMRLARVPLGFLINFNVPPIRDGIHRIAASDLG